MNNQILTLGLAALGGFILLRGSNKISIDEDTDYSDENALARMLASETSNYNARLIIGWITIQRAKRSGKSLLKFLTTNDKGASGFGKQDRRYLGQGIVHASTAKKATNETRKIAHSLFNEEISPSLEIKKHSPGSWYEKLKNVSDQDLIDRQKSWNEGIYGKIKGTNWYLYSRDAPWIKSLSEVPEVI